MADGFGLSLLVLSVVRYANIDGTGPVKRDCKSEPDGVELRDAIGFLSLTKDAVVRPVVVVQTPGGLLLSYLTRPVHAMAVLWLGERLRIE